jgi:hypothetical protein
VNVGAIVTSEDGRSVHARFDSDLKRARYLGGAEDLTFLRAFAKTFDEPQKGDRPVLIQVDDQPKWDLTQLQRAHSDWSNSIQLSEPRAVVDSEPRTLLDEVFDRYVAETVDTERSERARDRRWIVGEARRQLTDRIRRNDPSVRPEDVVRPNEPIDGDAETHRFQLVLHVGERLHAVDALSLESGSTREANADISIAAWALDDVRKAKPSLPLTLLVMEGADRQPVERLRRICQRLDTSLINEAELRHWVEKSMQLAPVR